MLELVRVAVTGGLSSGKTSVCQILKGLGAYVISADAIVHRALSSNQTVIEKVIELLGPKILTDKVIDRAKVAKMVFRDLDLLEDLEGILHPVVYEEIARHEQQLRKNRLYSFFVADIPLLFESRGETNFDFTIAVVASPEICSQRYCTRPGATPAHYESRAGRQYPQLEKALRADYVVMNSGTQEELEETVKDVYQEIRSFL